MEPTAPHENPVSNAPRIRGKFNQLSTDDYLKRKGLYDLNTIGGCIIIGLALLYLFSSDKSDALSNILTLVLGAGAGVYLFFRSSPAMPTALHAFNTEFLAPLADGTRLNITVFFEIPIYKHYDIEQLNRVTENFILPYCWRLRQPPSAQSLQDYLHEKLVTFQNEREYPILRLNIPIILHKENPNKPKKTVDV